MPILYFLDTSILDEVLEIPGWASRPETVQEFKNHASMGLQLAIPITAVIESGNHIEQSSGNRRPAAERYVTLLGQLISGTRPWKLVATEWDDALLQRIRDGAGTGRSLVDLLDAKAMGGGDAALVAEAERLQTGSYGLQVGLWSLDHGLKANWPFGNLLQ